MMTGQRKSLGGVRALLVGLSISLPGLLLSSPGAAVAQGSGFHELAHWEVGGEGGWDYLTCDSAGHRLFVTRGSHVMVISTETGKVIGDIAGTKGCHGVALAPDLGKGFVSDGGDDSVTVFDFKTLKTTGTVAVGKRPDAILYDPATHRVFTFNAGSQDTTAIDAATDKVVGTIPLGGKPEFAQSNGKGHVFVNIEDKSELVTFDARALTVLRHTALAPAEEPSGLAYDAKTHRLFAACGNKKAAVVDGETGKLIATPDIGDGPDAASVDSRLGLAFTSNGEGTLSILKASGASAYTSETVTTTRGARTMTLDPTTHRLYFASARYEAPAANAPTPANGRRPRPRMIPGSFTILVFGEK